MAFAPRIDVVLPERSRVRLEEDSKTQRAQKPHDIRNSIPRVDYTDPAKFPVYTFREYPKMPLLNGNRPITVDDSGGVLIFYSKEDEDEFYELNPGMADEIRANSPEIQAASAIQAKDAEISELRAKLAAAGIEPDADRKKPISEGGEAKPSIEDSKPANPLRNLGKPK